MQLSASGTLAAGCLSVKQEVQCIHEPLFHHTRLNCSANPRPALFPTLAVNRAGQSIIVPLTTALLGAATI